jgi:hypothetical protein
MAASTWVVSPRVNARPLHQLYSTNSILPTLFYQPQYLICCHLSIAQYIHNHENLLAIFARHTALHVITLLVQVLGPPKSLPAARLLLSTRASNTS